MVLLRLTKKVTYQRNKGGLKELRRTLKRSPVFLLPGKNPNKVGTQHQPPFQLFSVRAIGRSQIAIDADLLSGCLGKRIVV